MKKYNVTITETLKKSVEVSADSLDDAEQKVNDSWYRGDYILEADDFDDVEFEAHEPRPERLKVVLVKPNKLAEVAEIDASLSSMQGVVGGLIEATYYFDEEVALICNEEGKVNGMPLNRAIYDNEKQMIDIVAGPFFICDCSGEDFGSLSDEQLKKYSDMFRYPEQFFRTGDSIKTIPFKPQDKNCER